MKFGFQHNDPAQDGFQAIEDIATAYWYSEVLFCALELQLFSFLEENACTVVELATKAGCHEHELSRMLAALATMGLVARYDGQYFNSQAASLFLVQGKADYLGDFFLYRKYMRSQWQTLSEKVAAIARCPVEETSYALKNFNYVRAMDALARQKAQEIGSIIATEEMQGPFLDVGGGAGSLVRALRKIAGLQEADLFDIPEVVEAAGRLYPDPADWKGINVIAGDFRSHIFERRYGAVFLCNFLHAYGAEEAEVLLAKAIDLLSPDGLLVIHDYFPDREGVSPQKGALYDLAMMLNTYNGVCHEARQVQEWCRAKGMEVIAVKDLCTDSSVILAKRSGTLKMEQDVFVSMAKDLGLCGLYPLAPESVIITSWAREKCKHGCALYNNGLQCPPHGMPEEKTRLLLDEYKKAYLVRGTPPGRDFHKALLSLEKKAFLMGYHKAFVFGAGPCMVCDPCPNEGECRFPQLARPSMEGSGIDVYATAALVGVNLKPVRQKGAYVTYIGLLLVE